MRCARTRCIAVTKLKTSRARRTVPYPLPRKTSFIREAASTTSFLAVVEPWPSLTSSTSVKSLSSVVSLFFWPTFWAFMLKPKASRASASGGAGGGGGAQVGSKAKRSSPSIGPCSKQSRCRLASRHSYVGMVHVCAPTQ